MEYNIPSSTRAGCASQHSACWRNRPTQCSAEVAVPISRRRQKRREEDEVVEQSSSRVVAPQDNSISEVCSPYSRARRNRERHSEQKLLAMPLGIETPVIAPSFRNRIETPVIPSFRNRTPVTSM